MTLFDRILKRKKTKQNGFSEEEIKYLAYFFGICKKIKQVVKEIKQMEVEKKCGENRTKKTQELQRLKRQLIAASRQIYTKLSS